MDLAVPGRLRIEGPRHQRIAPVGPLGQDQGHPLRRPLGIARLDQAGPRRAALQGLQIALVVEEADLVRAGSAERRDAREAAIRIGPRAQLAAGDGGQFAKGQRPGRFEEARIDHDGGGT